MFAGTSGRTARKMALALSVAGGGFCCHDANAAAASGPVFAPYIDVSMAPNTELQTVMKQSGVSTFTLAFVVAQSATNPTTNVTTYACNAAWGGIGAITSDGIPAWAPTTTIQQQIKNVRAAGGNVIISFGGQDATLPYGEDLATACMATSTQTATQVKNLQAAYQAVINRYGATSLDFDIEGTNVTNHTAFRVRDRAILALKAATPGLKISYTLPVTPTGLDSDGVAVLTTARSDGLSPDVINVMAQNYGNAQTASQMLSDAEYAASDTGTQIGQAGLSSTVGITPMIGVNNSAGETFTLNDAKAFVGSEAGNTAWVTRLSFWSLNRDSACTTNSTLATCSGVSQGAWAFSKVFEQWQAAAAAAAGQD
jgi:hypothetical protein